MFTASICWLFSKISTHWPWVEHSGYLSFIQYADIKFSSGNSLKDAKHFLEDAFINVELNLVAVIAHGNSSKASFGLIVSS